MTILPPIAILVVSGLLFSVIWILDRRDMSDDATKRMARKQVSPRPCCEFADFVIDTVAQALLAAAALHFVPAVSVGLFTRAQHLRLQCASQILLSPVIDCSALLRAAGCEWNELPGHGLLARVLHRHLEQIRGLWRLLHHCLSCERSPRSLLEANAWILLGWHSVVLLDSAAQESQAADGAGDADFTRLLVRGQSAFLHSFLHF